MELMKETCLPQVVANQVYMILYMGGTPPSNVAELSAAVRVSDFTDMWNKSLGCAYATAAKSAPGSGVGADYTMMLNPKAGCGQLKGAVNRLDGITFAGTGYAVTPDTIGIETAAGVPITDSGWFGLFAANMLCRIPKGDGIAAASLSPRHITELSPVGNLVVGFSSPKTITGIQCERAATGSLAAFAVDYWNGASWVECLTSRPAARGWYAISPQPVATKMRIRVSSGALPALSEVAESFVFGAVEAPASAAVPNITWALVIPVTSRPYAAGSVSPYVAAITEGVIRRGVPVPLYAMTVAGPGGNAEIIVTKASGIQTTDSPQITGVYIQPGNLVE